MREPLALPVVVARRVLLDALVAFGAHRDAMVLIGAQAVYLRVGEADLAVAPFTTDGDLAVDVTVLADVPALEAVLAEAGFHRESAHEVGVWKPVAATAGLARSPSVDLLVPAATSPTPDGRTARLRGHDIRVARNARGIEAALVDCDPFTIAAHEPEDPREVSLRVAGVASLLIAKVHKIADRKGARARNKDALDVLRLLRGSDTDEVAERYALSLASPVSAAVAAEARDLLRTQFGSAAAPGIALLRGAVGDLADADEYAASCMALTHDLLDALPP